MIVDESGEVLFTKDEALEEQLEINEATARLKKRSLAKKLQQVVAMIVAYEKKINS